MIVSETFELISFLSEKFHISVSSQRVRCQDRSGVILVMSVGNRNRRQVAETGETRYESESERDEEDPDVFHNNFKVYEDEETGGVTLSLHNLRYAITWRGSSENPHKHSPGRHHRP